MLLFPNYGKLEIGYMFLLKKIYIYLFQVVNHSEIE